MRKSIPVFFNLVAAVLMSAAFAGCSKQSKALYHERRAKAFFDSGQYDKAEVEYVNVLRNRRDDAQAWAGLGTIYFEQGRLARALPCLRRGCDLAPGNFDLHDKLATVYVAAGKMKEARDETALVLNARPQDNQAPLVLAEVAVNAKEIEAAQKRLQDLLHIGDSPAIEVGLGTLYIRQHEFTLAEQAFKKAQNLDPKFAAAYSSLGALHSLQHDLKQAEIDYGTAADLSPIRSPRRIQYAEFKIQTGDAAAAKEILQEIINKTPDYIPASLAQASLAANEKRYDDCGRLLDAILARDPNNYEALLLHARTKIAGGEIGKGIAELEKMAKLYPQAPNICYQLAVANLANNDTATANIDLGRALALKPDFSDAIVLQAGLQIKAENLAPAIISLRDVIQKQPQLVEARLLLAEAYRRQGSLDDALNLYRELEKAFPRNAQAPFLTGLIYVQQKNPEQARQAFTRSLTIAPDYLPAVEQLINLDLADKHYDKAMESVQREVAKNPSSPEPRLLEAMVYLARNNTNQAETALLKAIQARPDFQQPYILLAHLYVSSRQNEKALQDLQAALAKDPKDVGALMLIGQIHDEQKDYQAARDAYEKLLAINPNFSPALNNLAYLYSEYLGELDKAYDAARRARELLPYDPFSADTLGWVLFKKGQYSAALNLLQDSAKNLPAQADAAGRAEVEFHLGMAHYMQGDEDLAREAFQHSLALSNGFKGSQECRDRLAILAMNGDSVGPEVRAILEKKLTEHPDDPVVLARLAAIDQHEGSLDKAINAYEMALKANPKNVHILIQLAQLYAAPPANNTQKAFEMARNAYKLAPDNYEASRTLGSLAFQTGDYKWSLALLQHAADAHPNDPDVLFELAQAAYAMGDLNTAQETARTALDSGLSRPRADQAKQFLEMLALAKDPQKAASAAARLDEMLKTQPDNVPVLVAAAVAREQSDIAAAQQMFEKVLNHYPDFTPAQKKLAILYLQDPAKDNKTYALALKASQALPDDAELQRILGIIAFRQGDYMQATKLLDQSAAKTKDDAELVYYLGMAQYRTKNLAASKTTLKAALTMNLRAELAAKAKQVLAELN